MDILQILTDEFHLKKSQVEKTVGLIDDGNTIPFIARYRKEVTGSLDDTVLRDLDERLRYLRSLQQRKEEVASAITAQEKMTDEIQSALDNAVTLTEVEDIYRPFKQRKKTRASVAKEKGLEPLAELILAQQKVYTPSLVEVAETYIDEEKKVTSAEDALAGACDIIAELISDNAAYRKEIRALTVEHGLMVSKQAKDEDSVYATYYDYQEKLNKIPSHRLLAINRGEKEEFLKVSVVVSEDLILNYLSYEVITDWKSPALPYLQRTIADSYKRLIAPSIENDIRAQLFDDASEGAIKLFSDNLKHLLMQPPVKGKVTLGLDPGYRTGCKLAVVDRTGKVLDTAVIYPTKPQERIAESEKIVGKLLDRYGVELIAIGNGTASKESEIFVANLLKKGNYTAKYAMVSEAGASVYSASKLGAAEFPDFDVTQRSAVSIARRLQDPLAELVKIEPQAIGVGQYQHDMKQSRLAEALGGVVEDCVNRVGVDVNTASHALLSYIAGINATSAKNIVKYREENGEFTSRAQILKVPRIGDKAYEQCAGFLRVTSSKEILDCTGVHPESYPAAHALLKKFGYTDEDVRAYRLGTLAKQASDYGMAKLADELGIGLPTLHDMIGELEKPGRDVRDGLPQPILRDDVMGMEDLEVGMELVGTVRNVIDFGAFVDIGVHQDGLVHVSELSHKFVKHPSDVVAVGDVVNVRVLSLDLKKKRIGLTMKL